MQIPDDPAPGHIAHDVFHRGEGLCGVRLVVHGQPDAGQDLVDQHHHADDSEDIPEIEIFRGVIPGGMLVPELGHGEAIINPIAQGKEITRSSIHEMASESSPTSTRVSVRYLWGGMMMLLGAGKFL